MVVLKSEGVMTSRVRVRVRVKEAVVTRESDTDWRDDRGDAHGWGDLGKGTGET